MSRPAVLMSVISMFVVANVRWHFDAELEPHRHVERAGARTPGIHLVVTARDRHTRSSELRLISRFTRLTMSLVIRSTSAKN